MIQFAVYLKNENRMHRSKGKPLTPEEKSFIITLKDYFDRNKKGF